MILFDPQSLEGKLIDQFRLDRFIGRGAMGLVYRSYDTVLQRTVAIKMIPKTEDPDDTKDDPGRRLIREAQAAGRLSHPSIVTVFSYGETPEFRYICMEYVSGKTLADYLRERKQVNVEQIVDIISQILLALDVASREGIVHRDIKPSNVMITTAGSVKVMDFGIAKLPSLSMTAPGTVLGTPYYMSPEQIMGQKVDTRSDIFSTGAVMYQLLTGGRPFEADSSSALIYKILHASPTPPEEMNSQIPEPLSEVIQKALAKNPANRYQTPLDMLSALREAAHASLAATQGEYAATLIAARPSTEPDRPITEQRTGSASQRIAGVETGKRVVLTAPEMVSQASQPTERPHLPPFSSSTRVPLEESRPSQAPPGPPIETEPEPPEEAGESIFAEPAQLTRTEPTSAAGPSRRRLALLATALGLLVAAYMIFRSPTEVSHVVAPQAPAQKQAQTNVASRDAAPPVTPAPAPPTAPEKPVEPQKSPPAPASPGLAYAPRGIPPQPSEQVQGAKSPETPSSHPAPPAPVPTEPQQAGTDQTAASARDRSASALRPRDSFPYQEAKPQETKPVEPAPVQERKPPEPTASRVQLLLSQAEKAYGDASRSSKEGGNPASYYREAFALEGRNVSIYESALRLANESVSSARKAARRKQVLSAKSHVERADEILTAIPQPPLDQYEATISNLKQELASISKSLEAPARTKASTPPASTSTRSRSTASRSSGRSSQPGILTEELNVGSTSPSGKKTTTKQKSPSPAPGILNETFR